MVKKRQNKTKGKYFYVGLITIIITTIGSTINNFLIRLILILPIPIVLAITCAKADTLEEIQIKERRKTKWKNTNTATHAKKYSKQNKQTNTAKNAQQN